MQISDLDTLKQNGETYDKWAAYGQSKTANMLMAYHLARILGKRGLLAFSVHPGLIMTSNLGTHLDFSNDPNNDFASMTKADQVLGNDEGFGKGVFETHAPISDAQGAATQVYASFEPSLKGMFLHRSTPGS